MPVYLQAGLWGLAAGGMLVVGAAIAWFARGPRLVVAGAILTMVADTRIPAAFALTRA